jgi:hypothetical protein
MLLYKNPIVERLKIWECNMNNIASKFKIGDVVHILYSKNSTGNCCVALAEISEIHRDYVKVDGIKLLTGNVVMKATGTETTPTTTSKIVFSRILKVSEKDPLMKNYLASF